MGLEATEVLGEEDNEGIMMARTDNTRDKIGRGVSTRRRGRVMGITGKMKAVIEEDTTINNRIGVSKLTTMNPT